MKKQKTSEQIKEYEEFRDIVIKVMKIFGGWEEHQKLLKKFKNSV